MQDYAVRHYGIHTWRLMNPNVIVEHFTGGNTFQSAWNTFASNDPDPGLGELPGTCAHLVVDTDGTIYQLVRFGIMCRHAVGLNWTALGIESVGVSDRQILNDSAQRTALLHLTLWLMDRFDIALRSVIGHNESLTSPFHRENYAAWRCQTHSDWNNADMDILRRDLASMAQAYDMRLGPPATPVASTC